MTAHRLFSLVLLPTSLAYPLGSAEIEQPTLRALFAKAVPIPQKANGFSKTCSATGHKHEAHPPIVPTASGIRQSGIVDGHPERWRDRVPPLHQFGGRGDDGRVHRTVVTGIQASSVLF